jgi:glutamate synthase domain-containing protein 2/glutamate synthase domain-containing protein 1/glutamate synthase domain-containing protein 3
MCGIALVADARGRRTHDIVEQALGALVRLAHRGAPPETASIDGSGILTQIPWDVFADDLPAAFSRPDARRALGMFFMPRARVEPLKRLIAAALRTAGFGECHWRPVPVSFENFNHTRRTDLPTILQVAAIAHDDAGDVDARLYRVRQRIDATAARERGHGFAVVSLSSRTVVYKGLLSPHELPAFFPDLRDAAFRSAIAIVHQRFSTNTTARWALAQPFHVLAHNGEIATIDGNRRWTGARLREEGIPSSLGTAADGWASDSSSLDEAVQGLTASGLELPHAFARLIPPAWEGDADLDPSVAAFYEFEACHGEPWDGPAAIAFSDGVVAGALLDRNGFRPSRYFRTRDERLYLGSEAGIFDVPDSAIVARRRLSPGGLVLADTRTGRILETEAARRRLAAARPYRTLVRRIVVPAATLGPAPETGDLLPSDLRCRQRLFGCTQEEIDLILRPMARDGMEAVGSMGDDAPLAPLSRFNRLLPDYFRQRFAQVTNPAMDPLRERCVMSLRVLVGSPSALVSLPSPVLDGPSFERVCGIPCVRPVSFGLWFEAADGPGGLEAAVEELTRAVVDAVANGAALIVLSDRAVSDANRIPMPPLLATAAVHDRLLAAGLRTRASVVLETDEARDAHQVATLLAFGASAVFPSLGFDTIAAVAGPDARAPYQHALEHGLLKIMSKMGVTTIAGYCGSALFDIFGLDGSVVRRWFHPAAARTSDGATMSDIARACMDRHRDAFAGSASPLAYPGFHSYRRNGEQHAYEPAIARQLHKSAASGSSEAYGAFVELVDARRPTAIRDLLAWTQTTAVAIDQVEPPAAIFRRFFSAAMSIGALSPEAHEALAIAMNRLGGRSNSGEGGEPHERAERGSGSAIKQVASARFGVTPAYLRSAEELQIKIAQGSKPGEGGQLPAIKVVDHIALLRHAQPGQTLISPPVHHDIYSIEDLAQLIFDLRRFHPAARIGVKLVSAAGVGLVAAGAAKAGADAILISGHDGGTGASPRSSIKHAGLPWELGLSEAHRTLTRLGLRGRVILQVDGGLQRGRDIAIAAALGADEYGVGTAALVAVGCVMARQCHLDTCPAGIATQRPDLRAKFKGTPEMIEQYFRMIAEDVRRTLAVLGLASLEDLIGRGDLLRARDGVPPRPIDVGSLTVHVPRQTAVRRNALSETRVDAVRIPADLGRPLVIRAHVRNVDRAIGSALAGEITARFGDRGLPDGSIVFDLEGAAGQSLGAFLVPGIQIQLRGETNDYAGKGMHGGTISIRPRDEQTRTGDVIAGNALLYGATGGAMFLRGAAGERFAVRNSGALAVVEGLGDHGCEYMTGGTVVNLGSSGRNFGSGMTGGVAYMLTPGALGEALDLQDWSLLESLLARHWKLTGSPLAASLLGEGTAAALRFRKLQPGGRSADQAGHREAVVAIDGGVEIANRQVLVGGVRHEN